MVRFMLNYFWSFCFSLIMFEFILLSFTDFLMQSLILTLIYTVTQCLPATSQWWRRRRQQLICSEDEPIREASLWCGRRWQNWCRPPTDPWSSSCWDPCKNPVGCPPRDKFFWLLTSRSDICRRNFYAAQSFACVVVQYRVGSWTFDRIHRLRRQTVRHRWCWAAFRPSQLK